MKQTKEDRLISEAYQQIFEKQVQSQLDEGVMNKLKSLALAGAVAAGSASAAPNNFNVPPKSDNPNLTSQTQNSPSAKGIIYQNDGWTAVNLSSKPGCLIFSKTNKNVQVSVDENGTATINVSYKDRGGVEMYRYMIDGTLAGLQPGMDVQNVSKSDSMADIKIPFDQAIQGGLGGKLLSVMVNTPEGKGITDRIDIGSLKDAVSACQKAMAQ